LLRIGNLAPSLSESTAGYAASTSPVFAQPDAASDYENPTDDGDGERPFVHPTFTPLTVKRRLSSYNPASNMPFFRSNRLPTKQKTATILLPLVPMV
jgi:hypothetical protein